MAAKLDQSKSSCLPASSCRVVMPLPSRCRKPLMPQYWFIEQHATIERHSACRASREPPLLSIVRYASEAYLHSGASCYVEPCGVNPTAGCRWAQCTRASGPSAAGSGSWARQFAPNRLPPAARQWCPISRRAGASGWRNHTLCSRWTRWHTQRRPGRIWQLRTSRQQRDTSRE